MNTHGINEGIVPIGGGWRYEQEYLGELWRIPQTGCCHTMNELVEAVMVFRINQGIDIGDPELDVANYIKEKSPQNDIFKTGPQPMRTRPKTPLIQIMREWLNKKRETRVALVSTSEATQRAQVCMNCPQNVKWQTDKCGECNDTVEYMGKALRKQSTFPPGDSLMACRLHQIHLPSAIFLDSQELPDRNCEAPAECWVNPSHHGQSTDCRSAQERREPA